MSNILKDKIKHKLLSQYNRFSFGENLSEEAIKEKITQVVEEVINAGETKIPPEEKSRLITEMVDEFTGFGPIQALLKDPSVTEIMINGPKKVYAERKGRTELTGIAFEDEAHIMYFVNKMLAPTRKHVDESYPYTEISLSDGSRVNIIIPPLALGGPIVTIRKFLKEIRAMEDLVDLGTLDKRMSDFLIASIKARLNIIFAGATGAGKTTTLNVLSSYIAGDERIVTIEDTAELRLSQEHVVRLESRQPNIEGRGEITLRDLFKNSLRMRPDRIILGEIRGSEALDMLQAICSGHRGSLAVLHANSPQDVIYRLETMILTSGVPINIDAIHRQIATAVNLIVQQEQLQDGSRKVTYISQVSGLKEDGVVLEDIFVYDLEGLDNEGKVTGRWKATGRVPVFYPIFKKMGIDLPLDLFKKD